MIKKKKELIIIVPGARYIKSVSHIIQNLIIFFYSTLEIQHPVYTNYVINWKNKFNKKNRTVIWLHWDQGIGLVSKWFAIKRLKKIINEYKNTSTIQLVGVSLGGEIALEAANSFPTGTLAKLVLVASINNHAKLNSNVLKIVNLYSEKDLFAKISTKILAPIHGGMRLFGKNITNIKLDNLSHDQFCSDIKIHSGKFSGKTITQIINSYLIKK